MKIKLLLLKYDKDCNITLAQNSSIYIILFHIYKCINAYMYVYIYLHLYIPVGPKQIFHAQFNSI